MAFHPCSPRRADTDNVLLRNIAYSLAVSLGDTGVDYYAAAPGTPHVGEWRILHAVSASIVIVIRDGVQTTIAIAATDRLYGKFTSVEVSTGAVELYRA